MSEIAGRGSDAAAIIDAARAAGHPAVPDPTRPAVFLVPEGTRLEELDLHAWQAAPTRHTGVYRPATVDSFVSYVERHALLDVSTVWVHPTSGRVVAVIDDNHPEGPGWGEWRVDLQLAPTPEWTYWLRRDGHMVGQEEFAEHIEGGLREIEEPDAATVLEIAQSFHASTGATFRSQRRLASGEVQIAYEETIQASAGRSGSLEVPSVIMLMVAPFIGEEERQLVARLRFRVAGGNLKLGYVLDRPHVIVRDALEQITERLAEKFPNTYVGEPAT